MANRVMTRSTHRSLAIVATVLALVTAACGSATTSPSAPAASGAPASVAPGSAAPGGSPAASAGYSGPRGHDRVRDLGRPRGDRQPDDARRVLRGGQPDIDVKVTVADWDAYWDKLQTGLAGGAAPDVFAMDGPLFPDYQARDVLLDLQPFIDARWLRPRPARRPGRRRTSQSSEGAQYGLPRDLNVIALYYNKAMFDAAGIPYPDDTWDWDKLVEVGQAADQGRRWRRQDRPVGLLHRDHRHGELLAVAGVAERRRRSSAPTASRPPWARAQAAGGIQFLQDLIYKDKILAEPAIFAETGDAFEQGQAAMEINGSWLVPTLLAAGHRPRHRAAPERPGRPVHVRQPDRRRRVQVARRRPTPRGSSSSTWSAPAAQEQLMQLKAALPVDRRRSSRARTRPRSTGAEVFADSLAYANLEAVVRGLRGVRRRSSRESWTTNVFITPNKTAQEALESVAPAARRAARRPVATAGDPLPRTRAAHRECGPAAARGGVGRAGGGAPGCRARWAALFLAPDAPRPRAAVGRAHPRHARHQPDRLGPADAARAGRPRQLPRPADRRTVPDRAPQHRLLHA